MESIEKIKINYNFSFRDAENLKSLMPIMEKYVEEFPHKFYRHIRHFERSGIFLKDEETITRHQAGLKIWFKQLFSGDYDNHYLSDISMIGARHVKIDLPAHYVNAAMHFVRQYCIHVLQKEVENDKERHYLVTSVDKILDINLDLLTSSYIEEEIKTVFLSKRVESYLIQFAERFSYGLNLILVLGLVIIGCLVLGLFGYELIHLFDGHDMESGLLTILGSLLMLWLIIELVDTEVRHLRGSKFTIKVFISVALVATIREILISSLRPGALTQQLSLIAGVAVLGAVYWLISKIGE